ncbi:hypothetical protein ACFLUJ_06455 [Chloroflexota bacterium]
MKGFILTFVLFCVLLFGACVELPQGVPFSPGGGSSQRDLKPTTVKDGVSIYHDAQPPYYGASPDKPVNLNNNETARNPTWDELLSFVELDDTDEGAYGFGVQVCADFANELHDNAEKAGIKAAWVALEFEDDSEGHALNMFETTDKGLVFVDSVGSIPIESIPLVNDETDISPSSSKSNDRIAYVQVGREYGLISLTVASSPLYSAYLTYVQKFNDYEARLATFITKVEGFNERVEAYNRDSEQYESLVGGRKEIADPKEYKELSSMYDQLERIGIELDRESSDIDGENESLERELTNLGLMRWEPQGIVRSVEIYW